MLRLGSRYVAMCSSPQMTEYGLRWHCPDCGVLRHSRLRDREIQTVCRFCHTALRFLIVVPDRDGVVCPSCGTNLGSYGEPEIMCDECEAYLIVLDTNSLVSWASVIEQLDMILQTHV